MDAKKTPVCAAKALSTRIAEYLYYFTLAAYEDLAGQVPGARFTKKNGYDTFSSVILREQWHPQDPVVKTKRIVSVSTHARQVVLAVYFHMMDEVAFGLGAGELNACTRLAWGAARAHGHLLEDSGRLISKYLGSEKAFSHYRYTGYSPRALECVTVFVKFLKCVALKMADFLIERPGAALNPPTVRTIVRGLAGAVPGAEKAVAEVDASLEWISGAVRITQAQFAELLSGEATGDRPAPSE